MRAHILQHVSFEGAGTIQNWLDAKGVETKITHLWQNETLPGLDEIDWLIVMGGPMNVNDETHHPWLAEEKKFIRSAIHAGKKVLEICLGAQLIASVLGARVYPNPVKEIGWFPIHLTTTKHPLLSGLPETFNGFHWHGDTFDLPAGATHLAFSDACKHQAFDYNGHVVGLQFHMESTPESVRLLTEHCVEELIVISTVQSAEVILGQTDAFTILNNHLICILDNLYKTSPVHIHLAS